MGWVDIALLAVLGVSILVGLMRGLVLEVLSLLGWVVAYFAAQWLAPELAPHLPVGTPNSALNQGAAFAICFIVVLIAWGLAARLVSMLVKATPLSFADRALGAGFGMLRGAVVLLAVATVIALTPLVRSAPWQASHGRVWLNEALNGLKPVLPPRVAQRLPA
jgi:membrane protein required for colicin V production